MKILQTIFLVLFIFGASVSYGAPKEKTIEGEYTYTCDNKTSQKEGCRLALEGARIDALAKEYGTIVTQDLLLSERIDSKGEDSKFFSLSSSEVKGEWIGDEGEPEYKFSFDKDHNMVIHCKIRGKAREISNESVDFEALVLRNTNNKNGASTDFYDGDDLFMYFMAPVDGYVNVFLLLEDGNVYQILPYISDRKGEAKVKKGCEYVFFDPDKQDRSLGTPNEFGIECKDEIEFNKIYVVFSPNYFSNPVTNAHSYGELPSMTEEDFSKWLVKTRHKDPRLGVRQMNLKIHPR